MGKRLLGSTAGVLLVISGCGGAATRSATPSAPEGAAVIRAWASALARGDVAAAGAFFAMPSRVQIQAGGPIATVTSPEQARMVNLELPCGATLVDARPVARYIDALFVLITRPGAQCVGLGGTARVAFVIRGGKFTVWRRIADEPGDASHATGPGGQAPAPQLPPAARSV